MSIELHIKDYCQNCVQFEPDLLKEPIYTSDGKMRIDMVVICRNRNKCNGMEEYIRKQIRSECLNENHRKDKKDV